MPLQPGDRLGAYEILSALGAGGMGEVYRARDTRLKRDVAIKVLPDALTHDTDRLARFQREAELLATLNHQNIGAVYGLEQTDPSTGSGQTAIVLELVEGDTLADRITRGPLPLDEALPIARQIVEALEAAHDRGIVHRDLKPANVKVTPDGKVKVLDFGLAKLDERSKSSLGGRSASLSGERDGITHSPTLSVHATNAGAILGTAAYMSPEQARGKPVDRRADIWAFGCVLYEMLSGRQTFGGDSITDIVSAITRDDPDWSALPAATPPHVRTLLRRCLQKDPQKRLPHIGIARIEIDEGPDVAVSTVAASTVAQGFSPALDARSARTALPWIVAAAAFAMFGAVLVSWAPWRTTPLRASIRLEAGIGAEASLVTDQGPAAVLSPDGTLLAFVAQKSGGTAQLFVRRVDHLDATVLSSTDNARNPFFSPDGQWIGFFADGKLKKISVTGGAAVVLCDALNGRGGSWAEDGTIVFQPSNTGTGANLGATLLSVSSAGGQPQPLTVRLEGEANQRWPQMLPGGRAVLYTAAVAAGDFSDASISVQLLPSHARKILVRGGYFGRYLLSGHLVYLHDGTLFAVPFDLGRLEVTGQAVPALEHVASSTGFGAAQFAVSNTGTFVYLAGSDISTILPITWLRRDGTTSPLRATPSGWSNVALSPDGRRLALDIVGRQIWMYDWTRDALQRLTFDVGADQMPVWTPDSRRVVFMAGAGGPANLFWVRADGAGAPERLTTNSNTQFPGSWHPSGKYLAYTEANPQTNNDVMILPIEGDEASGWKPGKPTVFVNSPFRESEPMFSPDGRWIAYFSSETGRNELFVRPFPGPGGKWQISTDGGVHPTWSRTRKELFYLAPDQRIVVVSYAVNGDSFNADKPRVWSDARLAILPRGIVGVTGRNFDLSPDGDRFAVALAPQATETKQDKVVFIFNFFDELKRVAPAARR